MLELDAGARGQVGGRAGARDELGQARRRGRPARGSRSTATIGDALRLGERDVLVDEVDVRIDDRELRSCVLQPKR